MFEIALAASFCTMVFYVAFGQITVRKLRKNPETRDHLGIEFASGLDIINVAQALAFPRFLSRIMERSKLSALHANSEALFKHTTKLDRCLGRTFYWLFLGSAFLIITVGIIDIANGSG